MELHNLKTNVTVIYLQCLTAILADPKPVKSPGQLAYDIPGQPDTTHDLLLQKVHAGDLERTLRKRRRRPYYCTVRKKSAVIERIRLYTGIALLQMYRKIISLDLEVNDHPVIIEIKI